MTPLIDLYRAVCEAWPEMKQPVHHVDRTSWWNDVGPDDRDGPCREPTARLICGAVWSSFVLNGNHKPAKDDPYNNKYSRLVAGSSCVCDEAFWFGWCNYGNLNQIYPIIGTGPDLCEASANALLTLAKEK